MQSEDVYVLLWIALGTSLPRVHHGRNPKVAFLRREVQLLSVTVQRGNAEMAIGGSSIAVTCLEHPAAGVMAVDGVRMHVFYVFDGHCWQ